MLADPRLRSSDSLPGTPACSSGFGSGSHRGLALVDLLMLFLLLWLVLLAILLPSLMRARELSKRTVCAANLKGIGTGLYVYANENAGMWPIAAHKPAVKDEVGEVTYAPGMIGKHRGEAGNLLAGDTDVNDTKMSTTRNLWTLVMHGASSPKTFICPSSDDVFNMDDNPQDFWDFKSYREVSYGYQVPYGKFGKPNVDADARVVLAAEKGPYGAVLEAGATDPGLPTADADDAPRTWKPWNSPNHKGEGQNALYPDGHADFVTKPTVSVGNDNIYTRWSNAAGVQGDDPSPRVQGTPPTGNETPWSNTDSLIYP